jgi:hypothetical protein
MKKSFLLIALLTITSTPGFAESISKLSFMSGCWKAIDEDGNNVSEVWFKPTANVLVGVSQTTNKANEMIEHGFLDIHQDTPNGDITYTSTFPGHSPTPLTLSSVAVSSDAVATAIFTNPEGVVRVMTYSKKSKDAINVRYEGVGKEGSFDFNTDFTREKCK